MKTLFQVAGYMGAVCLISGCCTSRALKSPPSGSVRVSDIVKEVQAAIDPYWQDPAHPSALPPIASVKIALQTVHDNRLSAEADYLVVAVKGYYDNAYTQEIDLTLVPAKPPVNKLFDLSMGDALKDAIGGVQKEIQATYASDSGHPLSTQEVDVQVSFAVTWDGSAGVAKWSIVPISISASDELSVKTTNTITVAFKVPSPGP